MIVVDTNVIAYLLIDGEHTAASRRVFAHDPEWCAPLLWRSELRNVLALYLRRGSMTLEQATALQEAAEGLLARREYIPRSRDVLALAAASGRSVYDCEFVATAQRVGVPLVTSDRQLRRAFPALTESLESFGA